MKAVEYTYQLDTAKKNYINQGNVYVAAPLYQLIGTNHKMDILIAIHGSGRNALSYRDNSFYRHQRNLAIKNNMIFVALSNGLDCWGLDDGLYNLIELYHDLSKRFMFSGKVVLWGSSAGAVLMHRFNRKMPEVVKSMIGTFPVYDLTSVYPQLHSCREAWKISTLTEFVNRTQDLNPSNFPKCIANKPYYISHGISDFAVPVNEHSIKLRDDVNSLGGQVTLKIVSGGHSTNNFNLYDNHILSRK